MNEPVPALRRIELEPGEVVERYLVEALVNVGGMGSVYKARHTTLRTVHVLKVPHDQTVSMRARLVQEGRAQAHLLHPNILRVTDVVNLRGDEGIGLVADFIDGEDMEVWLAGRPSWADRMRIFNQVVDAVGFAHRNGFLHRDLKPANVMVGRDGLARVADFGLTKVLIDELRVLETHTAASMGTLRYSAPEQLANAKQVDQRADVWSLGCMLYEVVCFRAPFEGDSPTEILRRELSGDLIPPERHVPDLPRPVLDAIRGAIETEVEDRLGSVDAFAAILRRAGDAPLEPPRPFEVVVPVRSSETMPPDTLIPDALPRPEPPNRSRASWVVVALSLGAAVVAAAIVPALVSGPIEVQPAEEGAAANVAPPVVDAPRPTEVAPSPVEASPRGRSSAQPSTAEVDRPAAGSAPGGGAPPQRDLAASPEVAPDADDTSIELDVSGLAGLTSVRIKTNCGHDTALAGSSTIRSVRVPRCPLGGRVVVDLGAGELVALLGPIDAATLRYRCRQLGTQLTCEPRS